MKASAIVILLGLAACTDQASGPPAAADSDPTVFDPLTGTLDRAAGVEDSLRDSAAERRRQLEQDQGL